MPTAVKVTVVPIDDGDGGAAEALTDAQGPGVTNVNWSAAEVALVPPAVVTVTCTVPAASAGLTTVI
jgi:hypothetical protein